LFTEIIVKWLKLTEAATLSTYIRQLPGSNMDQGIGCNVMSQGLVNLCITSREKKCNSQSTHTVPSKFFSCFQSPTVHSFENSIKLLVLILGYSKLK